MKKPVEGHPLYGEIPLVEHTSRGANGQEFRWYERDRDYKPPLPKGAVRGDPHLQNYCPAHHVPRYFYVDEERTCVQCGLRFVFGAKEQKFWYESLRFHCDSAAIRCPSCRKARRTLHALGCEIGAALKKLETKPRDPHVLLDLARATVAYRERTGQGNLNRAIAACRAALEEWPASPEALFWEGRCQQLAGRFAKARACYERFIGSAKTHLTKLVRQAERELEEMSAAAPRNPAT